MSRTKCSSCLHSQSSQTNRKLLHLRRLNDSIAAAATAATTAAADVIRIELTKYWQSISVFRSVNVRGKTYVKTIVSYDRLHITLVCMAVLTEEQCGATDESSLATRVLIHCGASDGGILFTLYAIKHNKRHWEAIAVDYCAYERKMKCEGCFEHVYMASTNHWRSSCL